MEKFIKRFLLVVFALSVVVSSLAIPNTTVFAKKKTITIALDAGHGGSDSGAVRGNLVERDINEKIVNYCKAELKKYSGVKVITTPRAIGNVVTGRDVRCLYAKNNGADAVISFHVNAGGGTGAEVWVPKSGNKVKESDTLARKVLQELTSLGLSNRGTKDGSSKQLGMVVYPASYGIPGILIEHGFIDSAYDTKYFSSSENIKKLGVADAKAIVSHFGLKKGSSDIDEEDLYDSKSVKVSVKLNSDQTKATINVTGVPGLDTADLQSVRFKVWSETDGKDDVNWYNAKRKSQKYTFAVPISDFKSTGKFKAEIYTKYGLAKEKKLTSKTFEVGNPSAKAKITKKNDTSGTFRVELTDVKSGGGVKKVTVDVWRDKKSTKKTYTPKNKKGKYTVKVDASDFGYKDGKYYVRAYIHNGQGQKIKVFSKKVTMTAPQTVASANVSKDFYINLKAEEIFGQGTDAIKKVQFNIWNSEIGKKKSLVKIKGKLSNGLYKAKTDVSKFDFATGKYKIEVYATYKNDITNKVASNSIKISSTLTKIMGPSVTSAKQLARYYKSKASYPSYYKDTDAKTLDAFCKMYIEECKAEGVRAEVAFAQAMKETGFLTYTGRVPINANNFAGLGAIDSDVNAWATYPNVRTGIRAQIQHLKAYASKEPLNKKCVDTRFGLVSRESAIYVEWLGISENPKGKGWATAKRYGYSVLNDYIKPLLRS